MTRVYSLTTCYSPDLLYGSTLVFDSVFTGFPDAAPVVIDQSPDRESRAVIRRKSEAAGWQYVRSDRMEIHAEYMERVILPLRDMDEPLVLVDPDVVFWDRFPSPEYWAGPITGRLLPAFRFGGVREAPRVHPSLWLIKSVQQLAARLIATRKARHDYRPFHPTNIGNVHYDTGAALYATMPDLFAELLPTGLDLYDHLYLGAAVKYITDPPAVVKKAHDAVKRGDVASIRGIWREQERWMREQG